MANIPQISTSNTFGQWVTSTQSVISKFNLLTDGGGSQIFYANTNLNIDGKANVTGDVLISGDLNVTGNINLDAIGFDDINANGSGYFGNTVTAGILIQAPSANIQTLIGQSGNFANTSYNHANSAFIQANSGFEVANSSSTYANGAFLAANTAAADGLAFAIALG